MYFAFSASFLMPNHSSSSQIPSPVSSAAASKSNLTSSRFISQALVSFHCCHGARPAWRQPQNKRAHADPPSPQPPRGQVVRTVSSIFALLFITAGLVYIAEQDVNPKIPDYFTAFYFALTTLTTVGFGDVVPVLRPTHIVPRSQNGARCGAVRCGALPRSAESRKDVRLGRPPLKPKGR